MDLTREGDSLYTLTFGRSRMTGWRCFLLVSGCYNSSPSHAPPPPRVAAGTADVL